MPTVSLTRKRFLLVMAVLVLVEVLSSFEHVMMIAAFPLIGEEFGFSAAGWTMTAFLLVQGSTAAIGARLGDIWGHARIIPILLVLSVSGSLLSALSHSIELLIVGRGLQGLSGAILPLAYAIAKQTAPSKELPFWIGTLTGGVTISAAGGFVLGGYISDLGDWRMIFWFTFFYGLICIALFLAFVPRFPGVSTDKRIDWLGATLLPAGLATTLYATGTAFGSGSIEPPTLFLGAIGALLLGWWWRAEWFHPQPLIQVRLLTERPILIGNLSFAIAGLGVMQFPIVMMQYLQQPVASGVGLGLSATVAGLLKLPSNVASLFAAMFAGWMCGRIGGHRVIQLGALLCAAAWFSMIFIRDTPWQVMTTAVFAASGGATLLASIPNLVLKFSPADRAGEATGLAMVTMRLASAVGAQVVAMLMAMSVMPSPNGRSYPTEAGYIGIFCAVAISGLLIALIASSISHYRPADDQAV
ncbi:MFS family permease [Sphingobium xenophagum]|uniref:MFS family permease n=1 Tax=Sphingobium xenophagum TaxID=121428 RepID=A0ABU1X4W5_SPHXE|nr:MFS transporter [Sphingobium xenophagum]MDR7156509.1 MFS family permease [Sphingobium xenophagum]